MKYNPNPEPGGWHKMEITETDKWVILKNFGPNNLNLMIEKNPEIDKPRYYIPSMEDIKVGYECEYFEPFAGRNQWIKYTFEFASDIMDFAETGLKYREKNYRTHYLTKEQIEAEGWKYEEHVSEYGTAYWFNKREYTLYHGTIDNPNKIMIIKSCNIREGCPIFDGNCPSINEFRYISKLLGI